MPKIDIKGGSYPRQTAIFENGKITLRDNAGQMLKYHARAAISDITTVSQSWGKRLFKIALKDGNEILCQCKRKVFELLYQEMVTGPRDGDIIVRPETSWEKTTRLSIQYSGGILFLALIAYAVFNSGPRNIDPNRIPYEERRNIEQMYYEVTSNPNMPEGVRKRYACSKSGELAEYYRGRGDNKSAQDWRDISQRECR